MLWIRWRLALGVLNFAKVMIVIFICSTAGSGQERYLGTGPGLFDAGTILNYQKEKERSEDRQRAMDQMDRETRRLEMQIEQMEYERWQRIRKRAFELMKTSQESCQRILDSCNKNISELESKKSDIEEAASKSSKQWFGNGINQYEYDAYIKRSNYSKIEKEINQYSKLKLSAEEYMMNYNFNELKQTFEPYIKMDTDDSREKLYQLMIATKCPEPDARMFSKIKYELDSMGIPYAVFPNGNRVEWLKIKSLMRFE